MSAPEPDWDDFESWAVADFLADQADRDLATRPCTCWDAATCEFGPVPCARCVADDLADGAA